MWHAYLFIFALAGIFSGFIGGLLGLGGGIVVVPVLTSLFPLFGIDSALNMHLAVGTSMATIIVTTSISTHAHYRRLNTSVLFRLGKKLWPGIVIGTMIGAIIAAHLSSQHLSLVFGIVMFLLALRMLFIQRKDEQENSEYHQWQLPRKWMLTVLSMIVGGFSSLLGIGGGLVVPMLQQFNVPMRYTVATSASCGLPIAFVGMISYMIIGYNETVHVAATVGYVYLPAFIVIAISSMLFTPLGVKLAHRISPQMLRLFFIMYLLAAGVKMIFF